MKIKRFFAPDMRRAIAQVRNTLGADAVILSNKAVDGGVELVAAIDYDEQAFEPPTAPAPQTPPPSKEERVAPFARSPEIRVGREAADQQEATTPQEVRPRVEWSQEPMLVEMRQEMRALRRMMEVELSGLAWRDLGERRPHVQELLLRLMGLGLSPDICQLLADRVSDIDTLEQAWRKALHFLAEAVPTTGDRLLEQGGVVALIGPTGVGKTTTIAKLAARFCLRHGQRHVALITTDSYRIGAPEQLNTYARILDVPVRTASNVEELNSALNAFCDRRLVLVDTAGMSQRDVRLSEQVSLLTAGNQPVRSFLVLSAATQLSALDQTIKAFAAARPDACILTKVDEAVSLGGVFSAAIRNKLPLAYVTDGQKVPEDLHLARAHSLVSQAVELGVDTNEEPDDQYLALALGGKVAHAHV